MFIFFWRVRSKQTSEIQISVLWRELATIKCVTCHSTAYNSNSLIAGKTRHEVTNHDIFHWAASLFRCCIVAVWWLSPAPQQWQITIYVGIRFLAHLHCKFRLAHIMGIWSNVLTRRAVLVIPRVCVCRKGFVTSFEPVLTSRRLHLYVQSCITHQNYPEVYKMYAVTKKLW